MVTHTTIQKYKQNYFALCITGLFGCKWHRYKQSMSRSKKSDVIWFLILVLVFLFITFWFYFWLSAQNESDDFNRFLFEKIGAWQSYLFIIILLASLTFGYLLFLMLLACCHILIKHQLFMHYVHRVLVVLVFIFGIAAVIALSVVGNGKDFRRLLESLMLDLSLKITGPFLQLGAVVVMTVLTWIIADRWMDMKNCCLRILSLVVFIAVMSGLYVAPVFISSPCIANWPDLPKKPYIIGHRGAPALAPENTLISFKYAAENNAFVLESDVRLSSDGVPFVLHDDTLKRTTNIDQLWPDLADTPAEKFNISQLKMLNAGSWYLDKDPFDTVSSLSNTQKTLFQNQSIPTLEEYIQLAKMLNKSVMFDVRVSEDHPHYNESEKIIVDTILSTGINAKQIYWLSTDRNITKLANFTLMSDSYSDLESLQTYHIQHVNARYNILTEERVRLLQAANITSNIWIVDTHWLFSLYWCMGVTSITTNKCHVFKDIDAPVWHLTPKSYLILWITTDAVSFIIIVTIFIVQRIQKGDTNFNPEMVHLQNPRSRRRYRAQNRVMKEKLLLTDDFNLDPRSHPDEITTQDVNGTTRHSYTSSVDNDGSVFTDDEITAEVSRTEVRPDMSTFNYHITSETR